MRAIRFHKLGDPDVLTFEQDVPEPIAGPGEVLIRVRAAGVNFADTRFRRGAYFVRPRFPQIPGMEAAGEVLALGEGVTGFSVGDRVMAMGGDAYAEQMKAPAVSVYPMPNGLGFEEAAALPVQGLTAHHLLHFMGRAAPGERILVHAAAGGVGTLAVQLARRLGAGQVIGTAGSPEKLELVRSLGAHEAIDYRKEDLVARVRELTGNVGVDVILEMLGGAEAYKNNLAILGPFGRLVVFGAASGDTKGTLEPVGLMPKNQSVIGYYLGPLVRRRELCAPVLDELGRAVAAGDLKVLIGGRYPLADAVRAHVEMEARGTVGKLVLLP